MKTLSTIFFLVLFVGIHTLYAFDYKPLDGIRCDPGYSGATRFENQDESEVLFVSYTNESATKSFFLPTRTAAEMWSFYNHPVPYCEVDHW